MGVLIEIVKLLLLDLGRAAIERWVKAKEKAHEHRRKKLEGKPK